MHMLLTSHLTENNILSADTQWRLSAGKGTATSLLTTTYQWFKMLMMCVQLFFFFDFHKPLDSIPHRPLLTKPSLVGLDANIVQWVANYLTSRHQEVAVMGLPLTMQLYYLEYHRDLY